MTAPPYMRWFPGDYAKDTLHLTRSEHGAYRLLIDAMWSAGGKLPSDDNRLARLALCTPLEWAECRDVILAYFQTRAGFIYQKRITRELAHYKTVSAKRKEAGKKGGEASVGNRKASSQANAKQMSSKSPHNQNQNQNQTPIGASIKDAPNRRREASLSLLGSDAPLSQSEIEQPQECDLENSPEQRAEIGRMMKQLARELGAKRA